MECAIQIKLGTCQAPMAPAKSSAARLLFHTPVLLELYQGRKLRFKVGYLQTIMVLVLKSSDPGKTNPVLLYPVEG